MGARAPRKGRMAFRSGPVAATRPYVVLGVPREDVETGLGTGPVRDGVVHHREPLLPGLLEVHAHVADRIAILRLRDRTVIHSASLGAIRTATAPRHRRASALTAPPGSRRAAPRSP